MAPRKVIGRCNRAVDPVSPRSIWAAGYSAQPIQSGIEFR
jgi:hypothetical protein